MRVAQGHPGVVRLHDHPDAQASLALSRDGFRRPTCCTCRYRRSTANRRTDGADQFLRCQLPASSRRVGAPGEPQRRQEETGADLPVRSHTPPTTAGVSSVDLQSDQGCTFRFTHANAISDWAAVRIYRLAAPTTAQSRAALGLASTTQRFRLESCSACRSRRRPCAGSRSR